MRIWKPNETEQLINLVGQHECIYNVRSLSYLDRSKKAESFNEILNDIKKTDSTITIEEIKRKWKNLRTQYMKEVRAVKQSKKSGSGVSDVYRPKLWCFEQLSFLEIHTKMRSSVDNINGKPSEFHIDDIASCNSGSSNDIAHVDTIVEACTNPSFYSCSSNEITQVDTIAEFTADENVECLPTGSKRKSVMVEHPKKKQKKSEAVLEFRKDLDAFKNVLSAKRKEKKFAWLGALVVETMDAVSPEDRDDAAWQVQCLMRKFKQEAQRKQGSSTSSVKDILELSLEGILEEDDI